MSPPRPLRALMRRLRHDCSGLAMTEFALSAPLLFGAGLGGIETANYVITQMEVSQTAIHIADNASRIGENSALENKRIFESDIDDLLVGANIQAGRGIDLYQHGRVIVSSLEAFNPTIHCTEAGGCPGGPAAEGEQFIHWQRCMGMKRVGSSYGTEYSVQPQGIGPDDDKVLAPDGSAVIFVEINYDYQPLISTFFIKHSNISAIASFIVRDSRDLSGIKQRNENSPDVVADCNVYSDLDAIQA